MDYPYFLSYYGIMGVLFRHQYLEKWHSNDKSDFIFDEQGKESDAPQRAWRWAKENAPPWAKALMGGRPIHRDERTFMPLQAADLFAWHSRRFYFERLRGNSYDSPEWKALCTLKCAEDLWDEERLKKGFRTLRSTGHIFEYDLPPGQRKRMKQFLKTLFESEEGG